MRLGWVFEPHIMRQFVFVPSLAHDLLCNDQKVKRDSKMIMSRECPFLVQVVVALGLIFVMI